MYTVIIKNFNDKEIAVFEKVSSFRLRENEYSCIGEVYSDILEIQHIIGSISVKTEFPYYSDFTMTVVG